MAITIKYNGYTFAGTGDDLLLLAPTSPPDMYEVWNPISEVLEWDTLAFGVKSDATGTKYIWTSLGEIYSTNTNEEYVIDDGDLMDYERGTPVEVYKDNILIRKYYLDSITARHGGIFEFSCVSLVGLLDERFHKGGVYFGTTAGAIIADILTGVTYSIDNDVSGITLYGWLPYDTARANLARVLFATGASFMKENDGTPYFRFNQPQASTDVSANTFYDRESSPVERFGTVRVIEHTFFDSASQTSEVLFDNRNSVAADNALIVFDEPQANLNAVGLSVVDSGANWAIVNGTGYLEGYAYVHIKRVVDMATGVNSSEEKEIADNGLISRLNSGSVISRMANYYANAIQHQIATKQTTEKAGDIIAFPTISGRTVTGYIHTIDNVVSGFVKSFLNVIANWTPTGLGNQYSEYFILTAADLSGGSFTIPAAHRGKPALAVLFGGAQGGAGGMNGEDGHAGEPYEWGRIVSRGYGGAGGHGGDGAYGGTGGRYVSIEIPSLDASYAGSIGAGGIGGAPVDYGEEFEEGELGGDTTFGGYSTIDGPVLEGPYINLIDGSVYGEAGDWGDNGQDGGKGGDVLSVNKRGDDGEDGGNFNTIWTGGQGGSGFRTSSSYGSGGGGGGAAYGNSAVDCTQHTDARNPATDGADAVAPAQAPFYRGGRGGHGGGGGGGSEYRYNGLSGNFTNQGAGGWASRGGQGADGFVLVYV